jgi:hypothetical protein
MPVLKKLNEARKAFHSTDLKKTGHNKFAGYSYFQLADFIAPALTIFDRVGLCALVSFNKEEARMTITDLEDGTECAITSPMSSAALKGCHEVQNLGAVQTYLRRYLWVAALDIVEHDALDFGEVAQARKGKKDAAEGIKDAGGVITPTNGALQALPADEREYLKEMAEGFIASGVFSVIVDVLEEENLDNDQKVALWSLLPSHIRSGIKKEQDARRVAA